MSTNKSNKKNEESTQNKSNAVTNLRISDNFDNGDFTGKVVFELPGNNFGEESEKCGKDSDNDVSNDFNGNMSSNGSADSVGYDEATGIGMCTAVGAANSSSQGFSRGSITNTIYGIIVLLQEVILYLDLT